MPMPPCICTISFETRWQTSPARALASETSWGASLALRCELAGGDTTRRGTVLINVSVVGEVRRGRALRRSGAGVGDALFVSGRLGEADAGLEELKHRKDVVGATNATLRKHLYPEPRVALGQWLADQRLATAAMDLSDGLSSDLPRLCAASKVGARVDADSLPLVRGRNPAHALRLALHGGDDYELLFTVSKSDVERVPRIYRGLKLTRIGEITSGKRVTVRKGGATRTLTAGGWDPFRK